jgi:hypothetical protein
LLLAANGVQKTEAERLLEASASSHSLDAQQRRQFIKVYGPKGPKMTWDQRAKAGVDAKHFQEALKAKS